MCIDKKYLDDDNKSIYCTYPFLIQDVRIGEIIRIDA
jgi:hypothetical protein